MKRLAHSTSLPIRRYFDRLETCHAVAKAVEIAQNDVERPALSNLLEWSQVTWMAAEFARLRGQAW